MKLIGAGAVTYVTQFQHKTSKMAFILSGHECEHLRVHACVTIIRVYELVLQMDMTQFHLMNDKD